MPRVFVSVGPRGSARRASSRLPADATPAELRAERERLRVELRRDAPEPATGFAADAARYLAAVASMPSIKDRRRDIALWVAEFGARTRQDITAAEIRTVRERWLTVGPRHRQRWVTDTATGQRVRRDVLEAVPLAPATVNHRLRALENLWTVLSPGTPNPVRDVPEVPETELPIGAIPPATIRAVLAVMRDSPTKARLRIMAATGLPNASLGRIEVQNFDAAGKAVWVPGRKKGAGTPGRLLPLTTEGVAAFRALKRWDAWGPFSKSTVRRAWRLACAKAKVSPIPRVYDLRHAWATAALPEIGLRPLQLLLGHSTAKLTERYARAAIDPALVAAVARVDRAQKKRPRKPR